jgi:NADH-quinone oxidoreductase subunit I
MRERSAGPDHEHKEAHARIGDGLVELKTPKSLEGSGSKTVVTDQPIPVTKFLK